MNPVLQKDLLGLLRLKRVAAVQVLFVAVLAGSGVGRVPQGGGAVGKGGGGGGGGEPAERGRAGDFLRGRAGAVRGAAGAGGDHARHRAGADRGDAALRALAFAGRGGAVAAPAAIQFRRDRPRVHADLARFPSAGGG